MATYNSTTGYSSTLNIVQPTGGNQTFQIQDQAASGTYNLCIQNTTACGFAPTTGGTGYIQNQNASAQSSSNFWISGTGQAATLQGNTSVLTPTLDSISGALSIGTSTATAITIGNTTNTATTSLIATTTLNLGNNANNKTINIGATSATANTTTLNLATSTGAAQTIDIGGTGGSGDSNASTAITLQAGATSEKLVNGGDTIQTYTNSTSAFEVQNSSSAPIFVVDTSTTSNLVSNPGFETGTTGWSADQGASSGATIAQNLVRGNTYQGQASLKVSTTAHADQGAETASFTTPLTTTTQYTLSFYAEASGSNFSTLRAGYSSTGAVGGESACSLNSSTVVTAGFTQYYCTFTTAGTLTSPYIFIEQSDATSRNFYVDGVEVNTGSTLVPYAAEGAIQLRGTINSPVTFQSGSNSTTAFQIQDSNGTENLFDADTLDSRVGIGTSTPGYTLDVQGGTGINSAQGYYDAGTQVLTSGLVLQNVTANTSILTAGTLGVARGGTGTGSTPSNGQLLIGNGSTYSAASLGVTGLTATPGSGTLSLSVNYGSTASEAVQGNTTLSCPTVSGNLTGGGGTITLGAGGSCTAIAMTATPNFTSASLGTVGSTEGTLTLNSSHASGVVVLEANTSQANTSTISFPVDTNTTDSICLVTLSNCSGTNAGSGDTSYIWNQTTQQASSNFNISGAGVIGTTLTAPTLQSAAATALTITGNAASTWSTSSGTLTLQSGSGTVSLGSSTALTASGNLSVEASGTGTLTVDTTGAGTVAIGNSATTVNIDNTGTAATTISIGTGNAANNVTVGSTNSGANTTIQAGATSESLATTGVTISTTGTPSAILQVQNSNGANLQSFDDYGDLEQLGYLDTPYGGVGTYGNLITNSETIGGTGWTLGNAETATQAATAAPNGQTTASKLQNGGTASGATHQTFTTTSTTNPYTFSLWVKAGNSSKISYGIYDSTASAWVGGLQTVTTLTSTWQRYIVTGTPAASGHTLIAYIYADGSASSTSGNYNYVWGAQAVQASIPGVYTTTTSSAIAAAYGASIDGGANISGNTASGTLTVGYTSVTSGVADFNGNVGIGTSTPGYTLDVQGGTGINSAQGYYDAGTQVLTSGLVLQNVTANTSILTAGTLGVARGGTGTGSTPSNGQLLIGNGSTYSAASLGVTGLTATPGSGTLSLSVNYGSTASEAVQGNTTLSCPTVSGNLTGGGGTITLGAGGSCTAIAMTATPNFTSASLGTVGSTEGTLTLNSSHASGVVVLEANTSQANTSTISFPVDTNTTDSICLVTLSNCSGTNAGSGDTSYIWNQNASAQSSSNFWISGTGQAATLQGNTSVLTPTLDSISGALSIGTSTATAITIGNTTNTATTSLIATTTLNLGNNANNKTINIGATSATANTTTLNLATSTGAAQTIDIGGTGGSGDSNASTAITLQAGATSEKLVNGGDTIQTYTNSTSAFEVKSSSASVVTVDTNGSQLEVTGTSSKGVEGALISLSGNCSGTNWSGSGTGPYTFSSTGTGTLTCTLSSATTINDNYLAIFTTNTGTDTADTIYPTVGGTAGQSATGSVTAMTDSAVATSSTTSVTFTISAAASGDTVGSISFHLITPSNNVLAIQNSDGSNGIELRAGGIGLANTFAGVIAGEDDTTGYDNVALGYSALQNTTTGYSNAAIGDAALTNNTTGDDDVAIGLWSLVSNQVGSGNSALGVGALDSNTSGSNDTGLGYATNVSTPILQNATAIGAYAEAGQSDSLILGSVNGLGNATNNTDVGIGTISPWNVLSVEPQQYDTGTVSQPTTTAVTGSGTTFTSAMAGDTITFSDGCTEQISTYKSATLLWTTWELGASHYCTEAAGTVYSINTESLEVKSNGDVGIGTVSPTTQLSVNGGNNIDPSWPDGLAGVPEFYQPGGSSVQIPSGYTFYITGLGTTTTQWLLTGNSSCSGVSGNLIVYVNASTSTTTLSTPIPIVGGNYLCASSGTTDIQVTGLLVSPGVTPEAQAITSGTGWTIPTNKTFWLEDPIDQDSNSGSSLNFYSGSSSCSGTPNGRVLWDLGEDTTNDLNSPIPLSGGTLCTGSADYIDLYGYDTTDTGLGGP